MPRPRLSKSQRLRVLCVLALGVSLSAFPAEAASSSGVDLAKQVVAAYGGAKLILENSEQGTRSIGRLVSKSSLSAASNEFECEVLSKGNKMRVETLVLGNRNVLAYDGKIAWTKNGGWIAPSPPTSVKRIADELKHGLNALVDMIDPATKFEALPSKLINGKLCEVLKLTPTHGLWTVFYVDPLSKLVTRCEFQGYDSEQGNEIIKGIDYSDYRTVDGMPTPFKMIEFSDGKPSTETVLQSVTMDNTVTDESFAMPPPGKVAGIVDNPVVLPFEYIGNEIVVNAKINDMPEARFIVDTGASQTVLDSRVAQSIGPLTATTFNVTSGAKAVSLNYTKIAKLKLGDVSVEDASALVKDLSSFATAIGQRPAGLLGSNVLRRFYVSIDYQNKKLVLSDPDAVVVPRGAKVIQTSPVFGSSALVVKGKIDHRQEVNFLVDTGAAFNNLPRRVADKLETGPVLPVGTIFGLDGKPVEIGSVKFKVLELGPVSITDPVFVVQPDNKPGTAGLFSAKSLGTLGNPLWAKSRISIDYRNERIIVEQPVDSERFDLFAARLNEIDRAYLRNSNIEEALKAYEELIEKARSERMQAGEALALSRIAGCYADRFQQTKDTKWLEAAVKDYDRASQIAAESKNRLVEGQILARWSMFHLNAPRSNTDLVSSQNLLKRAFARAAGDATIYSALGSALVKSGKTVDGLRFVNQALMFDPACWQALWTKYRVAEAEAKQAEMRVVLAQLQRYYTDFPQVKEAEAKLLRMKAPAVSRPATRKTNLRTKP